MPASRPVPAHPSRLIASVALAAALLCGFARAADPATLLPPDALTYFGWSKLIDPAGPTATHFKQLAAALRDQAARDGNEETAEFANAVEIGLELAAGSGAASLIDVRMQGSEPRFALAFVLADLRDAAAMQQRLMRIFEKGDTQFQSASLGGVTWQSAKLPGVEDSLRIAKIGDRLVFAVGDDAATGVAKALAGGPNLATSDTFSAARKLAAKYVEDERSAIYVDIRRAKSTVMAVLKASGEDIPPNADKIIDEIGVSALRSFYWRHDYKGQNADGVALLHTDANADKGLLKLARPKPLDPKLLQILPRNAYWATATAFDSSELWTELRRILDQIDASAGPQVDAGLNGARQMIGFSITDDFLPMLGREWAAFDSPDHGSLLFTGAVGVARPKDGAALKDMVSRFIEMATPLVAQQNVDLKQLTIKDGSQEITYLLAAGIPVPIAPAWTTVNDRLVFGLFPQTVAAAARRVAKASAADSLLAHPDVKDALSRWPKDLTGFGYLDIQGISNPAYGVYALASTALLSFAGKHGGQIDFGWLPPMPDWRPGLKDLVAADWHDENGIYYGYRGDVAASAFLFGGASSAVAGMLMPALAEAREQAKVTQSMSNLRQIATACLLYANDNDGKFPAELETLVTKGMLTKPVLHSPRDWDKERISYTLVGGTTKADPTDVLAYEMSFTYGEYLVAFADGHVEKMYEGEFAERMRKTYERQGRLDQLPPEFQAPPAEETTPEHSPSDEPPTNPEAP